MKYVKGIFLPNLILFRYMLKGINLRFVLHISFWCKLIYCKTVTTYLGETSS